MSLTINGIPYSDDVQPGTTLLTLVRETLGLKGSKEGCGRGECGACTVLVDGVPVVSCIQLVAVTDGAVTTIEGLREESQELREAFAEFGGFQCGFCTSGQVVHATALLREMRQAPPTDPEAFIRHRLSGNICRCTGYTGIVRAVLATYSRQSGAQQTENAA